MADPGALAFVEGRVTPLAKAQVPLIDRGFLLGDGVFETLRTVRGHVFRWDLHEARLRLGLAVLGIHHAAADEAAAAVATLVQEASASLGQALYVRVHVTRDASVSEPDDAPGTVTALARPLVPYPDDAYRDGVQLAVASWRKDPADPLASVKHMSYLPYLIARRRARRAGADDALILNTAGRVCEASHSNVVAVVRNTLHAPGKAEGALDGVTRHVVLEAARAGDFDVDGRLDAPTLAEAEELLLLNTIGGVVPVRAIKGLQAERIEVHGPIGARLRQAYLDALESAAGAPSV